MTRRTLIKYGFLALVSSILCLDLVFTSGKAYGEAVIHCFAMGLIVLMFKDNL